MWGFSSFGSQTTNNSLFGHRKNWKNKTVFTDEWEKMIEKGSSPKEIWESRYEEVNKINQDFTRKFDVKTERGKESFSPDMNAAVEQTTLIFGKGYVQEMQNRWEKFQEMGKPATEFWSDEKASFERNRRFWRWGHHTHHKDRCCWKKKEKEESAMFKEFDF
ncbi:uncharacterized protein LOC133174191 [Saccostrea echinata]|uniref:uncharacterized protein LOC133174191 n=1 Tax=Saccostrea echinata TaxID=191078 RepID=UPI002A800124|nr:uncharacterized protein LOC133174191 [Saccostrea echinata]